MRDEVERFGLRIHTFESERSVAGSSTRVLILDEEAGDEVRRYGNARPARSSGIKSLLSASDDRSAGPGHCPHVSSQAGAAQSCDEQVELRHGAQMDTLLQDFSGVLSTRPTIPRKQRVTSRIRNGCCAKICVSPPEFRKLLKFV